MNVSVPASTAAAELFQPNQWGVPTGVSPYLVQRKRFYEPNNTWGDLILSLKNSHTLYVGNLAFYTTEAQIYELFARAGPVKKVIMGLNKFDKTPCGFCFVEYYNHADAEACKKYLSGNKLDERVIRADLDPGFEDGRQYGRSMKSGGQIRDDHRTDYDSGRGGWAAEEQKNVFTSLQAMHPVGTTYVDTTSKTRGPDKIDVQRPEKKARSGAGPKDEEHDAASASSASASSSSSSSKSRDDDGDKDKDQDNNNANPRFREREQHDDDDDEADS